MRRWNVWTAALAAAAVMAGAPSASEAQGGLVVDGRTGVAVPIGRLADLERVGLVFGGGVGISVAPNLTARLDLDAAFLEGRRPESGALAPGINLFHYSGGVETRLSPGALRDRRITLAAGLGAGASTLEVEAFVIPAGSPRAGETVASSETYLSTYGGVRLGYPLSRRLEFSLGGRAFAVFADEQDTRVLELLSPEVEPLGTTWSFLVTGGLSLRP